MKKMVPDYIETLPLYPPGKPIEEVQREYGRSATEIIKLASNENCLGPSPKALKAIGDALLNIHRYPDNGCYLVTGKLAAKYGIDPEHILLGHGSNEIIQMIAQTFILPGEEVITSEQTFILYPLMGSARGATVIEVPLKNFTYDLDAIAQKITQSTKIIFISNPNNPTGTIVSDDSFRRFMMKVPEEVIVVMDEAYAEYVTSATYPDTLEYIRQERNVILLKTFSKAYGLAGLRIGYALCRPLLRNYMERVRVPFNVNVLAQVAALAALDDVEHVELSRKNNAEGLAYICRELEALGLSFVPTQANFILIKVGEVADAIYENLLREGVIVRSMASFGLNDYLRLTIGRPEENERFIRTLKTIITRGGAPHK